MITLSVRKIELAQIILISFFIATQLKAFAYMRPHTNTGLVLLEGCDLSVGLTQLFTLLVEWGAWISKAGTLTHDIQSEIPTWCQKGITPDLLFCFCYMVFTT